ncbi:unnamed protein product [Urochloa humidicola]
MNHQQDGEKVKLLGFWASPYVFRVIWALRIKGIEYDYIEEDLENKSSQLLEYNPVHKKVPVLLYRGEPVAESEVILEFIDEAWKDRGHRILPEDPYERAMARFWARFLQDKIGFVDLSFGPLSYVIPMYEEITGVKMITEEKVPSLSAWMGNFLSSPVVKDHLPPLDKLRLRFQAIREAFLNGKC